MPDDALRRFCALAGKPLKAINEWRLARRENDQHEANEAALRFLAILDADWSTQLSAVSEYVDAEDERIMAYGVWSHSGQEGAEPEGGEWL